MKFFRSMTAFVALALVSASALAQDGLKVTLGVKAWMHTWSTWDTFEPGNPPSFTTSPGRVGQTETELETAIVPSITVRMGNFFVSGDYFIKKEYDFIDSELATSSGYRKVEREEWSIIAGYYFVPQLAIAGGFKRVHQNFTLGSFDVNIDIPIIGLQGGAAIGESGDWFMYGNGFMGPISVSNAQGGGSSNQDGWYYSTELGVGYRLTNNISATIGYKYQTIRWEDINGKLPGYDTTTGWIAGLSFTF